jgi:hypothetical protein
MSKLLVTFFSTSGSSELTPHQAQQIAQAKTFRPDKDKLRHLPLALALILIVFPTMSFNAFRHTTTRPFLVEIGLLLSSLALKAGCRIVESLYLLQVGSPSLHFKSGSSRPPLVPQAPKPLP